VAALTVQETKHITVITVTVFIVYRTVSSDTSLYVLAYAGYIHTSFKESQYEGNLIKFLATNFSK
jgi:hypothetical protein